METRDIVLTLLITLVGVGIFYLLDPTLGGLIKKRKEGFANNMEEYGNVDNVIPASHSNTPGTGFPTMNHVGGYDQMEQNNKAHFAVNTNASPTPNAVPKPSQSESKVEGFQTLSPAPMPITDAEKPTNCYPKDQINPQELLPNDPNSKWAQVNPMGQGDIAGKNYLSAGALIGVNTIGQSLRNANYQLRSDPPNPQVKVSIWNQSTIEPDINRRPLEIA